MSDKPEMPAKKQRRARNRYNFTLMPLVVLLMFLVDPDSGLIQNMPAGAQALATLVSNLKPIIVVTLIHYTRKWVFDYVDIGEIYEKVMASENYVAMSLFALAMSIFTLGFSIVFATSQ